jgi:hypothetical protein
VRCWQMRPIPTVWFSAGRPFWIADEGGQGQTRK